MKVSLLAGGVVGVATLLGLFPATALAASTQGTTLTTSPISVNLKATPGKSVSTTLQVENDQPTPVLVNVQLETFRAYGTTGQAQLIPAKRGDQTLSWVHFSKTLFVAQPNVWTPVQMTVNLPSYAKLGYYYAAVFRPQTNLTNGNNNTNVKSGNAVLVLVDAESGNAKPQIDVTGFSASKKLYEYLPVTFSVTAENTGNIYLPPTGDIFISRTKSFQSTIDTLPVNSYLGNVLPGTSRVYTQQWADGFPKFVPNMVDGQTVTDKKGQSEEHIVWNFSNADKLRFGKYYAKLVLVYNNGSRDISTQAVVSFWVIPWKIISIIVLIVVLSSVGLYVSGHKLADRTFKLSRKMRKKR